jgi:hypothetical protein
MSNLDITSYNRQGRVFTIANPSAVALTAVATTTTGLIVFNPFGSGKKLVMVDWGWATSAVGTGVGNLGIALMPANVTAVTNTTPLTVQAADGSGAAGISIARASSSVTLPAAAVAVKWLGGNVWVTGGTGDHPYSLNGSLEGSIVVVPGAAVHFTIVTTVMTGLGSFTWIEVPV